MRRAQTSIHGEHGERSLVIEEMCASCAGHRGVVVSADRRSASEAVREEHDCAAAEVQTQTRRGLAAASPLGAHVTALPARRAV